MQPNQLQPLINFIVEHISEVISIVTAIAALWAAVAASDAAKETRQNTRAQIVSSLLDDYSKAETLDAILLLYSWEKQHGDKFLDEFRRLRHAAYESVKREDRARRLLAHYFEKVYVLLKNNLINENLARYILSRSQIETMRNVVEPLEEALNPDYESNTFSRLGSLYSIPKRKFPIANP